MPPLTLTLTHPDLTFYFSSRLKKQVYKKGKEMDQTCHLVDILCTGGCLYYACRRHTLLFCSDPTKTRTHTLQMHELMQRNTLITHLILLFTEKKNVLHVY